jgi:threonine dehydratase
VIGVQDVEDASRRLAGVVNQTPLLRHSELDEITGATVLLKPELFQSIGSFKIRGAYNLMSRLTREQAGRGVVAWSSGNHAQGVALAGKLLGIPAAIVMPEDAPAAKVENTQRLGGEVIAYDRYCEDREAIASALAAERNATLVPSYDHPQIIAGQGTVGLEIADESLALGLPVDKVLIPCGGGGLSGGSAVALRSRLPGVQIHTVEPEHYDDTARSLAQDERTCVSQATSSICDALLAGSPGQQTFDILRQLASDGFVVTETEVRQAMRWAFRHLKLVLEPGGAVALAALLAGKVEVGGLTVAAVLSGGNVDPALFAEIQTEPT